MAKTKQEAEQEIAEEKINFRLKVTRLGCSAELVEYIEEIEAQIREIKKEIDSIRFASMF
jgi:hypothetical protein